MTLVLNRLPRSSGSKDDTGYLANENKLEEYIKVA